MAVTTLKMERTLDSLHTNAINGVTIDFPFQAPGPNYVVIDADLEVIESFGVPQRPEIWVPVQPGKFVGTLQVHFNTSVPIWRLRVCVHMRIAIPTGANGQEEPLEAGNGRVILFEHANYGGRYVFVSSANSDLTKLDGGFWNDRVSSMVILEGTWLFYRDVAFQNRLVPALHPSLLIPNGKFPPGLYPVVDQIKLPNDTISSLICPPWQSLPGN